MKRLNEINSEQLHHPVEYVHLYRPSDHKQLYYMKNGYLDFALLNGTVMSCMVCRKIYFARYVRIDPEDKPACVRCGDSENQQEISAYGFVG